MVSFAVQKFLSLTGSHLLRFAFSSFIKGDIQKNIIFIYVIVLCLFLYSL